MILLKRRRLTLLPKEKSKTLTQQPRFEELRQIKSTDRTTKRKYKKPTRNTMKPISRRHKNTKRITDNVTRMKFSNTTNNTTKVPNQNVPSLIKSTQKASKTSSKKFKEAPFFPASVVCAAYHQDLSPN